MINHSYEKRSPSNLDEDARNSEPFMENKNPFVSWSVSLRQWIDCERKENTDSNLLRRLPALIFAIERYDDAIQRFSSALENYLSTLEDENRKRKQKERGQRRWKRRRGRSHCRPLVLLLLCCVLKLETYRDISDCLRSICKSESSGRLDFCPTSESFSIFIPTSPALAFKGPGPPRPRGAAAARSCVGAGASALPPEVDRLARADTRTSGFARQKR